MPNYEPTPRRFSIISVSRSASRRTSIDEAAPLKPITDLPVLQDSYAVDLVSALRYLQHVDHGSEEQRGRTRQVGGDNAMKAIQGHEGAITAPLSKRESSASTRERIAVWEERSRSQSKGRSKSRGKDTASRHRVSVVPEVPELTAAFAAMERREMATSEWEEDSGAAPAVSGMEETRPWNGARPSTPVHQTRGRPPTPDTTPRLSLLQRYGNAANNKGYEEQQRDLLDRILPEEETKARVELKRPTTPPSWLNSERLPAAILPLTSQATPEQNRREFYGENDNVHTPEGQRLQTSRGSGYTAVFQPGDHGHHAKGGRTTTPPQAQYYLPPELLSEEPPQKQGAQKSMPASPGPAKPSVAPPTQELLGQHGQPKYHTVWRIDSYQPDFPLPNRPPDYAAVQNPEQPQFVGTLLQELPRGQLPAESRNHPDTALDPYPYGRPTGPADGDWAINIPPSPSAAHLLGDQGTRPPGTGSTSRARTERYISRGEMRRHEWDTPSVMERALHAASVSMIQGLNVPVEMYRGLRDMYYPAPGRPDIIKAYPIRRRLPIR